MRIILKIKNKSCRPVCRANRYLGCWATQYETNTKKKKTNHEHAAILDFVAILET